jgi:glycosyltransferase involved in cell wall biosynthesis
MVLTVTEDTFSESDTTFLNDVNPGLKVFRAKSFEPFNIYKTITGKSKDEKLVASETISLTNKKFSHRISVWIRMNLFIPDARVGWYYPAIKEGKKIINNEKPDAIVSIGPPHSSHLIAKKLSSTFKVPHIPVFIDPWVDIAYYKDLKRSRVSVKIDSHLEKSVLENSNAVVFVTETMRKDYESKYPAIKNKSKILYWGYSEEDFGQSPVPFSKEDDAEIFLHAGNIFDFQNPKKFWKTIKQEIDTGRKLKLKFIGTVSPGVKNSIRDAGLDPFTEYKGFLPYHEMLNEMMNASYLLVCASEPRHVPGKLFEYLRAGKPIIAFGDGNEEVRNILQQANAGIMFGYQESGDDFFERKLQFNFNTEIIKNYERGTIAKHFNNILMKI